MKITILKIVILVFVILTSCNKKELPLIPIQYDFNNLKHKLNTSISDSIYNGFWRWDYMSSNNSMPDSTGIDYFMNIRQPDFIYNGERTLPCLSIKTNKNRIIEFSATIIFRLKDTKAKSIQDLLDSLTSFDLLKNKQIRQTIIENCIYKNVAPNFEETIELDISEKEYGYDRIRYKIKNSTE